eukprot:6475552-Amphidinium_carterae.1
MASNIVGRVAVALFMGLGSCCTLRPDAIEARDFMNDESQGAATELLRVRAVGVPRDCVSFCTLSETKGQNCSFITHLIIVHYHSLCLAHRRCSFLYFSIAFVRGDVFGNALCA